MFSSVGGESGEHLFDFPHFSGGLYIVFGESRWCRVLLTLCFLKGPKNDCKPAFSSFDGSILFLLM